MEQASALNTLDYIVIFTILLSGLLALMRGFVREVLSLLTWAGAYFVAARYYYLAEPLVRSHLGDKGHTAIASGAAGVLVFIGAFIVLSLLSFLLSSLIRGRALTAIDRSLGFIFGILRGGLVVSIVYLASISILYPDLDKPVSKPSTALLERPASAPAPENEEKDTKQPAPDFLMKARTRPALAYGAQILKAFLPKDQIDKTAKSYLSKKDAAADFVKEQSLETFAIPGVTRSPPSTIPQEDRDAINQAIKGKPAP